MSENHRIPGCFFVVRAVGEIGGAGGVILPAGVPDDKKRPTKDKISTTKHKTLIENFSERFIMTVQYDSLVWQKRMIRFSGRFM